MKVIKNKHFSVYNFRLSKVKLASVFGSLALLIMGLFMVPNFAPEATHAEGANADPTISIIPAGDLGLDVNPTASGNFGSVSANVSVSTTNTTGYTFTMSTVGTSTDLTNSRIDYTQSGNQNLKITNLSASTAQSSFANNKWGYNVSKSNTYIKGAANTYVPVPNSNSQQSDKEIEVTDTTGSNTYTFRYGVKADLTLPSGDYSNTLVYSATANPLPTMQDFDYAACQALTADQTVTLYDSRDDTPYTVAKLQDGNCWMTQNLELGEYGTSMNLTSDTSNVSSSGYTLNFSYANNSVYKGNSNKYGNYYSWSQATAGSGTTTAGEDAPYDICPKGWRLPSASSTGATDSEFYTMLNHYIATGTWSSNYWSGVNTSNLTNAPVSLVFPGYMNSSNGSISDQNSRSDWWSATASGASGAFDLHVYKNGTNSSVSPRIPYTNTGGFSVRCLLDKPVIKNDMYMQDVTQEHVINTPTDVTYTLKDKRDETEYTVAKLQDGNLWMLDNLRLDLTDSTVLNSLTTDNTNVDSASLTSLKSGNRAAGDRYASSGFAAWAQGDTVNAYNQAKANADYKDTVVSTTYGNGSGKIGVYYNYCAASAGNYCYDPDAGLDDTSTLQDAEYDICPKNWRMPTGGSSSEYQALLTAYNNNQTATDSGSLQYNLSTPLSGRFYSGSAYSQGSDGDFWSSTWYDANRMRSLRVYASEVDLSRSNYRFYGFSVRCMVPGA